MNKLRITTIKILSIAAILSCIYPAIMLLRNIFFSTNGGIEGLLVCIVTAHCGFFAAYYIVQNKSKRILNVFCYLTILIPVLASVLIYNGYFLGRLVFEILATTIFYLIGIRAHYQNEAEVLSSGKTILGAICLFSILIYNTYLQINSGKIISSYMVFFGCSFILLLMIIKSQSNIDRIFISMNSRTSGVAKGIRKFNLYLVFILFAATISLLVLKQFIWYAVSLCGLAATKTASFMGLIEDFLTPSGNMDHTRKNNLDTGVLPEISKHNDYRVVKIIAIVVLVLLLMFLLYRLGRLIIKKIKKTFVMSKTDSIGEEEVDFTDEVEGIIPNKSECSDKKSHNVRVKLNNLKKISDSVERIRFLYKYLLSKLVERGVKIKKSDTTYEIMQKSFEIEGMRNSITEITNEYNTIRYGENIPDKEQALKIESKFNSVLEALEDISG